MDEGTLPPMSQIEYSEPIRAALDLIENLVIEGVKHGHFNYGITSELGKQGRRLLIINAGKSHKFTIEEFEVPR
jgi:hypothetical protein